MALHEYDYEKEATVSIVKNILTDAIKMKASDIHFDPLPNELVIKFRINGDLVEYTTAPENVKSNIITRIKILSGMNITELTIPQIGSINFELSSKTHNMRTATIPVVEGEKVVVHLLNYSKNLKDFKSLGFEKENINKINEMLKDEDGIILITGTNSSGKTTSMYALLQVLNKKSLNIISVENPIKTKIEGINQVQINNEKGITYNNILKAILLSDPDVIAINELINDETIRAALRASITGRLVISTMHTKTAYTTIKSLLGMEIENYLLGSNLNGIISQRLVKKLCPTCRTKRKATEYEQKVLKEVLNEEIKEIYSPKGCEECQDGFVEQIPIVEVININDELRQAISNNRNQDLIYDIIYSENDSIIKDGFKKVKDGITSFEEIIKIIDVKTDIGSHNNRLKNLLLGKDSEEEEKENNQNVIDDKGINDADMASITAEDTTENAIIENKEENNTETTTDTKEHEEEKENKTKIDDKLLKAALDMINSHLDKKTTEEKSEPVVEEKEDSEQTIEIASPTEETTVKKEIKEEPKLEEQTQERVAVPETTKPQEENQQPEPSQIVEENVAPETQEEATTPTPIIIQKDDNTDDDNDDFNYGDSYLNNF